MRPFEPRPAHGETAPKRGMWTKADEALLRKGVWRYATPPRQPAHVPASTPNGRTICSACVLPILAERRRLPVNEFMATVPWEFGGDQPTDEFQERRRTT
jgi:hypothetical protein